jgi:DNA modification methylase
MTPVIIGGATLYNGDCREVMRTLADCSVDSIVCDPPYELGFMGKSWDSTGIANNVDVWREALRVLKPGGHLLAFSGTRTSHRMVCAIEDAGFEIRDSIPWLYGSGFPKSLNVSKAIDKARVEDVEPIRIICRAIRSAMDLRGQKSRDLVGLFDNCHPRLIDHWAARDTDSQPSLPTWEQWCVLRDALMLGSQLDDEVRRLNDRKGQPGDVYAEAEVLGNHEGVTPGFTGMRFDARDTTIRASSQAAQRWEGWGSALKPAHEPCCMARKPLTGTIAANVLIHGTGALNIDGCRVHNDDAQGGAYTVKRLKPGATLNETGGNWRPEGVDAEVFHGEMKPGRWPANIIHDGSAEVVALFPEQASGSRAAGVRAGMGFHGADGDGGPAIEGSAGSAARFFYCAKASRTDRNDGTAALPQKKGGMVSNTSGQHMTRRDEAYVAPLSGNHHPTVKPTDLMAYLVRLVTPPGGLVLDPFMGSGSTGKACMREDFRFVGIDLSTEYVEIARARIEHEIAAIAARATAAQEAADLAARQIDLFAEAP